MTNHEFFQFRVEHEVTSVEIADHIGATRRELLNVETGKAPVLNAYITAVKEIAANR